MKRLFVLWWLFSCLLSNGAWTIPLDGSQTSARSSHGGRISFSPEDGGNAGYASFDGALAELSRRNRVSELRSIHLKVIKSEDFNKRLVSELRKRKPKVFARIAVREGEWVSWKNADVQELRRELEPSVLALEEFSGIKDALGKFGLKVSGASSEKFSLNTRGKKTSLFGFGIWISVEPSHFGMADEKNEGELYLNIQSLVKSDGRWLATFYLSAPKKEDVRIYGRWSAKDKAYVIDKRRLGWSEGNGWKSEARPVLGEDLISFRIKKGTSHLVKIDLGTEMRRRAAIRIYGPKLSVLSESFILGKRSYAFRDADDAK